MDPSSTSLGSRSYDDFVPLSEWIGGEGSDTVVIELPGFKKENLRVQLDNYGNLRTGGERQMDGNQWRRFRKEFHVPDNCDASGIRAKFDNGVLTITLPKLITEADPVPVAQSPVQASETRPMPQPSEPELKEPGPERRVNNGKGVREKTEERERVDEGVVKEEHGKLGVGCLVLGMKNRRRQLVMDVAVAAVVFVGIGIYVACKFKRIPDPEIGGAAAI